MEDAKMEVKRTVGIVCAKGISLGVATQRDKRDARCSLVLWSTVIRNSVYMFAMVCLKPALLMAEKDGNETDVPSQNLPWYTSECLIDHRLKLKA